MNPDGPSQRMRDPSNGTANGLQRAPRSQEDGATMAARGVSAPKVQITDRAELFEDEKKRIVQSCFSKKDPADGQASESYITHIRIIEDAAYPSTPPPAQSPEENKKDRVIIVAVRKNGRVRMHKARENDNNTFSIGKTWNLDDLNSIQSFTNAVPVTPEDRQNKQRAGAVGFIVTITKPYYWQSGTPKEKDFFIFSLIKIYKKYTGGRIPELIGFDHQELETFSAAMGPPPGAARPVRPEPSKTESNGSAQGTLSSRPPPTQHPTQHPTQQPIQQSMRQPSGPQTQIHNSGMGQQQERLPPPRSENRPHPSQERLPQERPPHDRAFPERPLRTTDSEERIAQIPGSFPQSDFVRDLRPQTSQSQLRPKRSESSSLQNEYLVQPTTNNPEDPSYNEPQFRVLHSARTGDDRTRQNGAYINGPQQGTPPRSNQAPVPFRTGAPPSSHPSQESLKEQLRPPVSDFKAGSLVPRGLRTQSSNESSRPPTIDRSSREPSKERWHPVPDPSKDAFHHPSYQRATPSEGSRYEESRPFTVVRDTTADVTPPSTTTENTEPDLSTAPPSLSTMPTPPETPTESHRPGLGPMIKTKRSNKEIASQFRKGATAYNAFKPRAGGAADRLREQQQSPTGAPDGITGVVPAPSLLKNPSQNIANNPRSQTPDLQPVEQPYQQGVVPTVKVDSPPPKPATPVKAQPLAQRPPSPQGVPEKEPEKLDQLEKPTDEHRRQRKSDHSAKYAKALAVDPQILAGRTFDVEASLNDFGWGEEVDQRCSYEELQANVQQELERAEAGGWINAIEQNDDRIVALGSMMDRVIAECEELDGLLTLYGVELSTLSEDVAYIEAQSQGLQVQAANQKLLHTELKMLLDTISISSSDLRSLREASLTKPSGIHDVETTLSHLYTAMMTIDPKTRRYGTPPQSVDSQKTDRRLSSSVGNSELSSIRAVRERKDSYQLEINDFVQRFKQYMAVKFKETESHTKDKLQNGRNSSTVRNPPRLDVRLWEGPQQALWAYSPLLLFSREMAPLQWEGLIRMYEGSAKAPYQEEFRDNVFAWKRISRKPTTDEQDLLFTSQEKESESLVGRKLTVKRSKTVRAETNNRISSGEKPSDGKVDAYEAFSGALNEMVRVVFTEQNFVTEIFHLTSAHNADFNDAVNAVRPEARTAKDLTERKPFEADRDLARRLHNTMEEIYSFWPTDVQNLVDWVVKQDQMQGVGVIATLESKLIELEETNQEYLVQTISKLHDRLVTVFNRFVDEQIHGIEDTKVKIKKRKGVIAFMKTFPNFSLAIEAMLPPLTQLPIRALIDDAYRKINRAMFESLKFIAKESPTAAQALPSGGDPEDKEVLNYHILLIENMNHYVEETYAKDNTVLSEWKVQAQQEMAEHMDLYLAAVLRRPLGKLLDFIESAETQLANLQPDQSPHVIATRPSHSRSVLKKILSVYDSKEIRKGIDTLKKRVEKHFGEADDVNLSRGLVATVLRECEKRYLGFGERTRRLVREVYEGSVEVEWRDEDVGGAFRKGL
ncbi:MAG: hypothetical protein Q9218_007321 [Villophora microphyllina]